jgi:hypothetical protein
MPDVDNIAINETSPTRRDYEEIAERLTDGRAIPFFGAGASLGCGLLPSGAELAKKIAEIAEFPDPDQYSNLPLVASYLVLRKDSLKLQTLLREVFNVDAKTSDLHRCITSIDRLRLIVTTNYDDLIENALEERWKRTNNDLYRPWIVVDKSTPGTVLLRQMGAKSLEVEAKNLSKKIRDPEPAPGMPQLYRPILFKMHGSLDRQDQQRDCFLITEEDYVNYLGRPDGGQIPPMLLQIMRDNSFLFLGYGLRDWNVRVILHKMKINRDRKVQSWAIVKKAGLAEKRLWEAHGVRIFEVDLQIFAEELQNHL